MQKSYPPAGSLILDLDPSGATPLVELPLVFGSKRLVNSSDLAGQIARIAALDCRCDPRVHTSRQSTPLGHRDYSIQRSICGRFVAKEDGTAVAPRRFEALGARPTAVVTKDGAR